MAYDPVAGMIVDDINLSPDDIFPNGTRLLIQRREASETAHGGKIIIPETAKTPDYIAKVLAVGEDVESFAAGDWVIIGRWNAVSFKLLVNKDAASSDEAYKTFHIVDEEDVWARVKDFKG
jgi:co-chaperonin GroES (HSP10)